MPESVELRTARLAYETETALVQQRTARIDLVGSSSASARPGHFRRDGHRRRHRLDRLTSSRRRRRRAVLAGFNIGEVTGTLLAAEVATLPGVSKSWVYEQAREGRIPTVTLGRYRRYRREAIEAWITQIEGPARGARAYGVRRAA